MTTVTSPSSEEVIVVSGRAEVRYLYAVVKRLLLVTHRSPDQIGGPSARLKAIVRYLPALGWEVDVVAAPAPASAVEFSEREDDRRRVQRRATVMGRVASAASPAFKVAGLRPGAMPLSVLWLRPGTR